jgi:hypothetical protein
VANQLVTHSVERRNAPASPHRSRRFTGAQRAHANRGRQCQSPDAEDAAAA